MNSYRVIGVLTILGLIGGVVAGERAWSSGVDGVEVEVVDVKAHDVLEFRSLKGGKTHLLALDSRGTNQSCLSNRRQEVKDFLEEEYVGEKLFLIHSYGRYFAKFKDNESGFAIATGYSDFKSDETVGKNLTQKFCN